MTENRMAEANEAEELTQLLLSLFDAAQQLPEGAERQNAFRTVDGFQKRLSGYLRPSLIAF